VHILVLLLIFLSSDLDKAVDYLVSKGEIKTQMANLPSCPDQLAKFPEACFRILGFY
jgi:hypothetical protein